MSNGRTTAVVMSMNKQNICSRVDCNNSLVNSNILLHLSKMVDCSLESTLLPPSCPLQNKFMIVKIVRLECLQLSWLFGMTDSFRNSTINFLYFRKYELNNTIKSIIVFRMNSSKQITFFLHKIILQKLGIYYS